MAKKPQFVPCLPMAPPEEQWEACARTACQINPCNRPFCPAPDQLAVLTTKYWGAGGVKLTVGFPFDGTPADLQRRVVEHMNAWGAFANVKFTLASDPQVRIARGGSGYWSYLGTDILSIPRNQPTMNLQGFTMRTAESEFIRVVRHETGHTLGFPHEHMRSDLVNRLDREKTIAWGRAELGWSRQMVIQQILTPLSEASIMGSPAADEDSIMCYQLPASITKDGQPIRGGADINVVDREFARKIYPHADPPPPPPPPPPGTETWRIASQSEREIRLSRDTTDTAPPPRPGQLGVTLLREAAGAGLQASAASNHDPHARSLKSGA